MYPLYIPVYVPKVLRDAVVATCAALRFCRPRADCKRKTTRIAGVSFARFVFPLNFITGPLIANLFLLAILAIGREEVAAGTIGADNISPIDIMAFFITLAYIAVSLDASGLIRYLAYKVLQWGGKSGRRLFFYLYMFWFSLTAFIGNDPIILSGTPFLAYMTRVAKNIDSPRAWIYTQFTMANVASAILVSSNPTNLVLAGAFSIRFIDYTANIVVPVIITAVLLFPFMLYVVFRSEKLVPSTIEMHELPEEARQRKPVNPNIPTAAAPAPLTSDGNVSDSSGAADTGKLISLEEIMNPYMDKWSACFIACVMAVTILTVLAINAGFASSGLPVPHAFYCTLPGAFLAFCWDIGAGWLRRHESREIARRGRSSHNAVMGDDSSLESVGGRPDDAEANRPVPPTSSAPVTTTATDEEKKQLEREAAAMDARQRTLSTAKSLNEEEKKELDRLAARTNSNNNSSTSIPAPAPAPAAAAAAQGPEPTTLSTLAARGWQWARETFPNASHVLALLPWALIPFAFSMFVLVQALVTKGWVPVFAYGWDHWVQATGTVGAIGGMGFLAVMLCNVRFFFSPSLPLLSPPSDLLFSNTSPHSSPAPTSAPPSSSRASSRPGRRSTARAACPSATAPFGPPSTAWPWASTTAPFPWPFPAPSPASCGATSSPRSTSTSAASSLPASTCP